MPGGPEVCAETTLQNTNPNVSMQAIIIPKLENGNRFIALDPFILRQVLSIVYASYLDSFRGAIDAKD